MASWQTYIDDQMLKAGFMYATINGHDGSLWASSPGFSVGTDEILELANALQSEDSGMGGIPQKGFTIVGQKYTFTRGEAGDDDGGPAYIHGRCKEDDKSSQGVIVYCTEQAILIGVHDPAYSDGNSFGKCNTELSKVAEYIMQLGY